MVGTSKPNVIEVHKYERMGRINTILKAIQACKDRETTADRESLIAECQFLWGASRRTILEYLKVLIDTKRILVIDGEITVR